MYSDTFFSQQTAVQPSIAEAIQSAQLKLVAAQKDDDFAESAEKRFQAMRERVLDEGVVVLAHYYAPEQTQRLALETGGIVADSLEMAKFGTEADADTLLVASVRFMAETAKILSPEKTVLFSDASAECSLDLSCNADDFRKYIAQHPERTVISYANTSAEVKAMSDWIVTSSIAVELIEHLTAQGEALIWAPDKHLGNYLRRETGADMLLWGGSCVVHEEFQAKELEKLLQIHTDAAVLAHPESPLEVLELADHVGSTSQLLKAARTVEQSKLIIATDSGMFHSIHRAVPDKELIPAPTNGAGGTCKSCSRCPWMALNHLDAIDSALNNQQLHEVIIEPQVIADARRPLERMLAFGASLQS